jgi:hypothetical protein
LEKESYGHWRFPQAPVRVIQCFPPVVPIFQRASPHFLTISVISRDMSPNLNVLPLIALASAPRGGPLRFVFSPALAVASRLQDCPELQVRKEVELFQAAFSNCRSWGSNAIRTTGEARKGKSRYFGGSLREHLLERGHRRAGQ